MEQADLKRTTKFVFKMNKQGSQVIGNRAFVRKPTFKDFENEILPRTRKGYFKGLSVKDKYKDMLLKEPTNRILYVDNGNGWKVGFILPLKDMKDYLSYPIEQGWCINVKKFESNVAEDFRLLADLH